MCCYRIRCHIVCRMLDRRKGVNILAHRKNNDSSRVLSGTSSDTRTTAYDTVNLTATFLDSSFFVIILNISIGSFIRQSSDCTGTVCLSRSENNFGIFMCLTLVFTREVKVNIRFLISLKSKEGFKRDIKSVFYQRLTAHRTVFIRHINPCTARIGFYIIRIEIIIMTFLTIVMRTERINLRNTGHSCHKGGTY